MFSKDSCPICFGPTRWTNNVFYVCEIKHHHTYKMDPVIDSYFIKFENIVVHGESKSNKAFIKTVGGRFLTTNNNFIIHVPNDIIFQLNTEENILEYIKNLELIS